MPKENSRAPVIITLLSLLFVLFGALVLIGWYANFPYLIQPKPGYTVTTANAALCFLLTGIAFYAAYFGHKKTQFVVSGFIIIFVLLILSQYIFNIDFGVDRFLYPKPENIDTTQYPGRIAINSGAAFLLGAVALFMMGLREHKYFPLIIQLLILCVFFLGLLGLIGSVLRLYLLYPWYNVFRMALYTAIGICVFGMALWYLWSKTSSYKGYFSGRDLQKITFMNTTILISVALIVGLTGFTILIHQFEGRLKVSLKNQLQERMTWLTESIKRPIAEINVLLHSATFHNIDKGLADSKDTKAFSKLARGEGFSAFTLTTNNNKTILSSGTFAQNPVMSVRINLPGEMYLFWKNGWYLLIVGKTTTGNFYRAEWPLKSVDQIFSNYRNLGKTGELMLCKLASSDRAQCFPTRFSPNGFTTPLIVKGHPIPMAHALNQKEGEAVAYDYRGVLVLAAYSPIKELGLGAVLKITTAEAYAQTRSELESMLPLVLTSLVLGSLLLNRQVTPLIKKIILSEQSSARLAAIIESSTDAVVCETFEGIITQWNHGAENMYGYTEKEAINKSISLIVPPNRLDEIKNILKRVQKGEKIESFESVRRHKKGKLIPVSITIFPVKSHQGEFLVAATISRDITEQKKQEEALLTSNRRVLAIMNASQHAIIATNLKGIITEFNPAAERMLGYRAEEMVGKQSPEIIHDADEVERRADELSKKLGKMIRPGFETFIANVQDEGVDEREWTYVRQDGSCFPVLLTITALHGAKNKIIGYLGIAQDITERKKIEKLKNEFISVVSHELRTPLTSIKGSLSLLMGGAVGELPPKVQQLLNIAKQNSERLIRLINDILDIEKIESGKMEFHSKPVQLNSLVEETIAANQSFALQYGVKVRFFPEPNNVEICSDRDRLIQVITNLVSNAIKFSPKDSEVEVKITNENNNLRVSVRDHGPGIPQEFRQRIFHKFAQADSSATRERGGTGLGLSISKAIVEKLGGEIHFVTSHQGTTFYFDLPLVKHNLKPSENIKQPVILVCTASDERFFALEKMLHHHNCQTIHAKSPEKAREILQQQEVDAIVLDLIFSNNEAQNLVKEIRCNQKLAKLPIVVISLNTAENKIGLNGYAFTIIDWLEEPLNSSRLLQAIQLIKKQIPNYLPNVLHIEDDMDLAEIVATLLNGKAHVVNVTTLEAAKQQIAKQAFDLIILDLQLPDGPGVNLLSSFGKEHIPVVVFSAYDLPRDYSRFVFKSMMKSKTTNEELLQTITAAVQMKKD